MSWNKVYSLFPLDTLAHHQFWPLRALDDVFGARLAELATQGWTTRHLVWADLDGELPSGLGARRVGDRDSLVMTLTPALAHTGLAPDYVLELSEFDVNTRAPVQDFPTDHRVFWGQINQIEAQSTASRELIITLGELKSHSLRHRYTTRENGAWRDFARKRLERWTEVELYKTDRDKRPADFADYPDFLGLPPSDFQVPATWDFADDQMPIWYQTWCSQNGLCKPAFSSQVPS